MKRKFLFGMGCLFLILSSSIVFAESQGLYIGGRLGACFLNDSTLSEEGVALTVETEFDTGMVLEGAVGYDFGMFRAEGEIGYRKNDVDKFSAFGLSVEGNGDVDTLSFMINGYFDIETQSGLTPFIGAGIGYAKISANDWSVGGIDIGSEDDSVFAYQLGLGLGYSVTKNWIIDIAYKYFATEDPDFEGTEAEYDSHNITIGFRYAF
ncbi:MAG: outer membrane beta-barrel protein [Desulfobacteraceae bacterium]|nr:outer membrane beta-barrel protein [Desulfobacteraceae bacterium]MDH3874971.1 outer membrane beta-barrel protein [Desulfobacteraceae bacterium]